MLPENRENEVAFERKKFPCSSIKRQRQFPVLTFYLQITALIFPSRKRREEVGNSARHPVLDNYAHAVKENFLILRAAVSFLSMLFKGREITVEFIGMG